MIQHVHKPVWKSQRYLEKTSLSGYLESMQYFATLIQTPEEVASTTSNGLKTTTLKPESSMGKNGNFNLNVQQQQHHQQDYQNEFWLSDDLIDPKEPFSSKFTIIDMIDPTDAVVDESIDEMKFSKSAPQQQEQQQQRRRTGLGFGRLRASNKKNNSGSFNSEKLEIGASSENNNAAAAADVLTTSSNRNRRQLQLIVSKCRCEFYMIDFDDKLPTSTEETPATSSLVNRTTDNQPTVNNFRPSSSSSSCWNEQLLNNNVHFCFFF